MVRAAARISQRSVRGTGQNVVILDCAKSSSVSCHRAFQECTLRGVNFMKRTPALCLLAAAVSLGAAPALHAEDNALQRGYRYTPATGSGTTYRVQPVNGVQPVVRAIYDSQPAVRPQTVLPAVGQQVVL